MAIFDELFDDDGQFDELVDGLKSWLQAATSNYRAAYKAAPEETTKLQEAAFEGSRARRRLYLIIVLLVVLAFVLLLPSASSLGRLQNLQSCLSSCLQRGLSVIASCAMPVLCRAVAQQAVGYPSS